MIYSFGVIIQFDVIIYSLIGRIIYYYFYDTKYENFGKYEEAIWQKNYYIKCSIMFGLTLLIFPVCLLKDISKMRFASMFGICALIYSILVVVIESPFFSKKKIYMKLIGLIYRMGLKLMKIIFLNFLVQLQLSFLFFLVILELFPFTNH
jgi:hypothetical protein